VTSVVSVTEGYVRTVEKPWGREEVFTMASLPYVGKVIHVRAGCRLSLQIHERKTETMILLSGSADLMLGNECGELRKVPMEPSLGYTIRPGIQHRLWAITDVVVLEVSTPEVGVTLRLEDDYGRPDERRT
jgi:mannose-6-phosphate isomerase